MKAQTKKKISKVEDAVADEMDALIHFVHRRRSREPDEPGIHSFQITRAEVVFTSEVTAVALEKKPERCVLCILAPPVSPEKEEERRIFLLTQFGEVILRCQKEAYLQIRDMLLSLRDGARLFKGRSAR